MSFATRVILAAFSLSALASAVGAAGCSASAGTDAREATGATAEGIVGRCSPGYECAQPRGRGREPSGAPPWSARCAGLHPSVRGDDPRGAWG